MLTDALLVNNMLAAHRRQRSSTSRLPPYRNTSIIEDEEGVFWHLTDWHVNEFQPTRANPCDYCRSSMAAAKEICRLPPAGSFGHANCDATPAFWSEAVKMMLRVAPAPDFLLSGGDWIGNVGKAFEGRGSVRSAAVLLATMLHQAFPQVPTLHTIGNHDTVPYYSVADAWREWEEAWRADPRLGGAYVRTQFPDDALQLWQRGGYYARVLREARGGSRRLFGISLNTNDIALTGGYKQLTWLAKTLAALRHTGAAAILLGHIPPGPSHFELDSICLPGHYYQRAGGACWARDGQRRLLRILARFSDVVPASYFGHHHTDSVRLISDPVRTEAPQTDSGPAHRMRHVAYLTPSLTPRNPPHSPTIRLYRYSRVTGRAIDYRDFRVEDLAKANARGYADWAETPTQLNTPPLNLSSLHPAEWHRALTALLAADHSPLATEELRPTDPFLRWVTPSRCSLQAYVASGRPEVPSLRKCKLAHLCAALFIEDEPYAKCIGH